MKLLFHYQGKHLYFTSCETLLSVTVVFIIFFNIEKIGFLLRGHNHNSQLSLVMIFWRSLDSFCFCNSIRGTNFAATHFMSSCPSVKISKTQLHRIPLPSNAVNLLINQIIKYQTKFVNFHLPSIGVLGSKVASYER